jgi:hypothetical protein
MSASTRSPNTEQRERLIAEIEALARKIIAALEAAAPRKRIEIESLIG